MISKIRVMLEYNTYCLWLYDENGEIIDNCNPPEWEDDQKLTDAFMAVSDFYDIFFINNKREFRFKGSKNPADSERLRNLINHAMELLYKKNNGKYEIQNDMNPRDINLNPDK